MWTRESLPEGQRGEFGMDSKPVSSGGGALGGTIQHSVSTAIQQVLAERKWSLRQLAQECDISYAHMRRLRDGEISDPGIEVILRLAEIGRLSLDRMFGLPHAARADLSLASLAQNSQISSALQRIDARLADIAEMIEVQSSIEPDVSTQVGRARRKLIRGFLKYLEEFRHGEDNAADDSHAVAG